MNTIQKNLLGLLLLFISISIVICGYWFENLKWWSILISFLCLIIGDSQFKQGGKLSLISSVFFVLFYFSIGCMSIVFQNMGLGIMIATIAIIILSVLLYEKKLVK